MTRVTALLVILMFWMVGCTTVKNPYGLNLIVTKHRPFVIDQSDKPRGWGHYSHPRLIKISDEVLLLNYYLHGDNLHSYIDQDIRAISRDGGITWDFEKNGLDPVVIQHAFYWGYDISTTNGVVLGRKGSAVLVDNSASIIQGPWDVTINKNGFKSGGPWHRRIQMPDGRMASSSYADKYVVEAASSQNKKEVIKRNRVHFWESLDGGQTWKAIGLIADSADAPWGSEGPCESTIEYLQDGTILCISRTGYPHNMNPFTPPEKRPTESLLMSKSFDGGRSWEHYRMRQAGVYPRLLRMSNGVLVLGFGRPGNNLVFSTDDGVTWGHELALTKADVRTSGYIDIAEVSPGRLFVVYDMFDTDKNGIWLWEPKEVNGVFGCFVDVKRLWGESGIENGDRTSGVGLPCEVPQGTQTKQEDRMSDNENRNGDGNVKSDAKEASKKIGLRL